MYRVWNQSWKINMFHRPKPRSFWVELVYDRWLTSRYLEWYIFKRINSGDLLLLLTTLYSFSLFLHHEKARKAVQANANVLKQIFPGENVLGFPYNFAPSLLTRTPPPPPNSPRKVLDTRLTLVYCDIWVMWGLPLPFMHECAFFCGSFWIWLTTLYMHWSRDIIFVLILIQGQITLLSLWNRSSFRIFETLTSVTSIDLVYNVIVIISEITCRVQWDYSLIARELSLLYADVALPQYLPNKCHIKKKVQERNWKTHGFTR